MFSRSGNPLLIYIITELPCLGDLENPGRLSYGSTRTTYSEVQVNVSYFSFFCLISIECSIKMLQTDNDSSDPYRIEATPSLYRPTR